jgi:hypothetical protein
MNWKSILKMVGSTAAGASAQIITTGLQSGASPTSGAFWGGVGINTGLVALLALLAHLVPSPVESAPASPVEKP